MFDHFDPWLTALGDGTSPHLSTLWKRRMSLLESTLTARHATTSAAPVTDGPRRHGSPRISYPPSGIG